MGRINVTFSNFCGAFGLQHSTTYVVVLTLIAQGWLKSWKNTDRSQKKAREPGCNKGETYGTEQCKELTEESD